MSTSFGPPNRCPICQTALSADAASHFGETHCPRCSAKLWFVHLPTTGTRFMVRSGEPFFPALARVLGPRHEHLALGLPAIIDKLDSLDWVEVLADIEDALPQLSAPNT